MCDSRADNYPGGAQRIPGHSTRWANDLSGRKGMFRTLFAIALLVPCFVTSQAAQAAKTDVRAIRADCFRQANEAARAQVGMASANPAASAEGNAVGADAYYACIRRAGLRR